MINVSRGVRGFVCVDPLARFWPKVGKAGPNECWPWTGTTDGRYGLFWVSGRHVRAHRFSWEIANRQPFPDGKDACHTCDNPSCVNPIHIFPGSPSDNALDAVRKGRVIVPTLRGFRGPNAGKTHCKRGHEFTAENTTLKNERRACKACQRWHQAKYDAKRRPLPELPA